MDFFNNFYWSSPRNSTKIMYRLSIIFLICPRVLSTLFTSIKIGLKISFDMRRSRKEREAERYYYPGSLNQGCNRMFPILFVILALCSKWEDKQLNPVEFVVNDLAKIILDDAKVKCWSIIMVLVC